MTPGNDDCIRARASAASLLWGALFGDLARSLATVRDHADRASKMPIRKLHRATNESVRQSSAGACGRCLGAEQAPRRPDLL